jgi:hypothetical protein
MFEYDSRGNQITEQRRDDNYGARYTYNLRNELVQTQYGNADLVVSGNEGYYYNAQGQRVRKTEGANYETLYYYSGSEVLFTTNGEGLFTTENILAAEGC